jgi:peptide/nickel transport system permease protein
MLRFLARRLTWAVFTLWAVSVLTFLVMQLPPGDFASSYVAQQEETSHQKIDVDALRHRLGLDKPAIEQYWDWIKGIVLHGDFGRSLSLHRPVTDVIAGDFGYTILVAFLAVLVTWVLAVPLGIYSAVRRYSLFDYVVTFFSFVGLAIPTFLLALVLLYFGFDLFGWNVGGLFSPQYQSAPWSVGRVLNLLQHLIVPSIVLAAGGIANLSRIMRANLLDELSKPYVVTAQAKGLTRRKLITKYPVRVAMNPFASGIGLMMREAMSDTIIVSIILSLPTFGPTLVSALRAQDMLLAGAIILLLGVITIVGTIISDLVLAALDPRIRHAG